MKYPAPDLKALEELWRERLNDAKLRLDFAREYVREVTRDLPSKEIMNSDDDYAYDRAIRAENMAMQDYRQVVRIHHDLTVNGVVPDEGEWLKRRASGANASADGRDSST